MESHPGKERRALPDGRREDDHYNKAWCIEKHKQLDRQMEVFQEQFNRFEGLLTRIILVLFGNLFGFATLCLTLWLKSEGEL